MSDPSKKGSNRHLKETFSTRDNNVGFLNTVVNSVATVGSKLLLSIIDPLVSSSKVVRNGVHVDEVYTMGGAIWELRDKIPNIFNPGNSDLLITWAQTSTDEEKKSLASSVSLLLGPQDYSPVKTYLDYYNKDNAVVTIAPVDDTGNEGLEYYSANDGGAPKKITMSVSALSFNSSVEISSDVFGNVEEKDGVVGLRITSQYNTPDKYYISVQVACGSDVSYAHASSEEGDSGSSDGTDIFVPFPAGTSFPNDFVDRLIVSIRLNETSFNTYTKGCAVGVNASS